MREYSRLESQTRLNKCECWYTFFTLYGVSPKYSAGSAVGWNERAGKRMTRDMVKGKCYKEKECYSDLRETNKVQHHLFVGCSRYKYSRLLLLMLFLISLVLTYIDCSNSVDFHGSVVKAIQFRMSKPVFFSWTNVWAAGSFKNIWPLRKPRMMVLFESYIVSRMLNLLML